MRRYLPLFLVQGYLAFTVALYFFGFVDFKTQNLFLFLPLLFLYFLAFTLGYAIFIPSSFPARPAKRIKVSNIFFYTCFFFGLIGVFNTYRNLMLTDSFIPLDITGDIFRGLNEPGVVYAERMKIILAGENTNSSRIFNIASIFISFFKLLFVFIFVYAWSDLNWWRRSLSVLYCGLLLAGGIASGTNSVIFIFFIFVIFSLYFLLYIRRYKHIMALTGLCVFLFFIPILMFGYSMSQRGGGFEYFALTSPLGHISVDIETPELNTLSGMLLYSLVWLNYYLVQGYYGFSLILDLDFNWTFGFGNSAFLQRQFELLTGVDISSLTYQHRVSDVWDASAQWHSFYGQLANDLGLIGVAGFMAFLGAFLSRVWASIFIKNSLYGIALLPIFALMILFVPANNQVFGYIDTLSYFLMVGLLWLFENKSIRFF